MLSFRRATLADMQIYLDWRNEESTRLNSLQANLISEIDHENWFNQKINSTNCFMYLFEKDGIACGQVRLDQTEVDNFMISYSIALEFRGLGFGKIMLSIALDECRKLRGMSCKFTAVVQKGNIASIKTFEAIGFTLDSEANLNQLPCMIFKL